jgi:Tol biopolymer transport system component
LTFSSPNGTGVVELHIVELTAGSKPPQRTLAPNPRISGSPAFMPDGKALAYRITEDGVSNLWIQPLGGSPGRRITSFKSSAFKEFDWSPNGRELAILRTNTQSDIAVLRESTSPQ